MGVESKTGYAGRVEPTAGPVVACGPGATAAEAGLAARGRKPFLPPDALVAGLRSRGVTFGLVSEADAAAYLRDANNYLRCASYRALFDRKPPAGEGGGPGDYANLDFGQLQDLSSIDRQLREAFLQICIDVEHFAKIHVLNRAYGEGEDGYAVVADYVAGLNHRERSRLSGSLAARAREGETHDEYTGDLIAHHLDDLPLWVFLKVVEFGFFVDFYRFCAERWGDAAMAQEHYVLKSVKALRNATAHNSCIVNGFTPRAEKAEFPVNALLADSMTALGIKNSKTRRAKMGNLRIAQMGSALWALRRFCTSAHTLERDAARIDALRSRVDSSSSLYAKTNSIMPYFDFLWKLVDIWLPARA